MGQPRLITAQLNRIQCGRWGWLQGFGFMCHTSGVGEVARERCNEGLSAGSKVP